MTDLFLLTKVGVDMLKISKISCLMIAKNQIEIIKRSTQCYLNQTYPTKELIILSQQSHDYNQEIKSYILSLKRSDIHFIVAPTILTLGAMRNLSVELSTGSVICQWDDDDFHHPLRLSTQYSHLTQDGIVASLYTQYLHFFETTGEMYWVDRSRKPKDDQRYLPGTIMFSKTLFHRWDNLLYPEKGRQSQSEESWNVLQKLYSIGRIAPIKDGFQYIYTYNGNNTYNSDHYKIDINQLVLDIPQLIEKKNQISKSLSLCNVQSSVVRSLSEIAFTYEKDNT